MMLVLGLDPGSIRTGYAYIHADGERLSYVECGVISAPASHEKYARLVEIGNDLEQQLAARRPDTVAIEAGFIAAFGGQHQQGAIVSAAARGVIGYIAARSGLPLVEYAPKTLKKAITASGTSSKAQVAQMVQRLLGMQRAPEPDAAADALAAAICHARSLPASARAGKAA